MKEFIIAPSSTLVIQEGNIEQIHIETEDKLDLEVKKQQIQIHRIFQIRKISRPLYASTPTGYRTST